VNILEYQLVDKADGKQKIYEILDLEVGEISLVNKGANKKTFIFLKGEQMDRELLLKSILETDLDKAQELAEIIKELSEEAKESIIGAMKLLQAYSDEIPEEIIIALAQLAGAEMKEEEKSEVAEEEKAEEVQKMDPEIQAKIEEIQKAEKEAIKKTEKLEKELAEIKEIQKIEKYNKEAKKYMVPGLPTEQLSSILKDLSEKEYYKQLLESFGTITAIVEKSEVLKEAGDNKVSENLTAMQELDQKAQLIKSAAPHRTDAQCFLMAAEENPELYTKYIKENKE